MQKLDLVIVYNHMEKIAEWVTPAEAARICGASPVSEIVDLTYPFYDEMAKLAGPKRNALPRLDLSFRSGRLNGSKRSNRSNRANLPNRIKQ